MTQPIEGFVRTLDGLPLPGTLIVPLGVEREASNPPTFTDGEGHYDLPSLAIVAPSSLGVQALKPGYVSEWQNLPYLTLPDHATRVDVKMQPAIVLVDRVTIDLSNSDIAYGQDDARGLPPRRWPVKVFRLTPGSRLVAVQAEWDGPAPIRLWAERREHQESREGDTFGDGHGQLLIVPADWLADDDDGVVFTVGLPVSTDGLHEPVSVRLSVQPWGD